MIDGSKRMVDKSLSYSIPRLKPERVFVSDQNGEVLSEEISEKEISFSSYANDEIKVITSAIKEIVDFQVERGIIGFYVNGSTGEGMVMSEEERMQVVEAVVNGNTLDLYIGAKNDKPKFIELEWRFESNENICVLGDAWERSYGNLEFLRLCENDRFACDTG